jgi:hypothetical protein
VALAQGLRRRLAVHPAALLGEPAGVRDPPAQGDAGDGGVLAACQEFGVDAAQPDGAQMEAVGVVSRWLRNASCSDRTLTSTASATSAAVRGSPQWSSFEQRQGLLRPAGADRLITLGCDRAQGFLISPALPADELEGLLGS